MAHNHSEHTYLTQKSIGLHHTDLGRLCSMILNAPIWDAQIYKTI